MLIQYKYTCFKLLFSLVFALVLLLPSNVNAQETSATFAVGSIEIGYDNRACIVGLKGLLRYNTVTNVMEYCNGTSWVGF